MVAILRPHNIFDPGTPCPWAPGDGKLSELIEWTDVIGGTGTVAIGTIPADARYLACTVEVITAFDAETGNDLIVGIPTDTDYFIEDGHATMADSITEATNVLDYKPTSNVIVSAIYTHTGTVPTAGKAIVTLYYKRPL